MRQVYNKGITDVNIRSAETNVSLKTKQYMEIYLPYLNFISLVISKGLTFIYEQSTQYYALKAYNPDGNIYYSSDIDANTDPTGYANFESTYKSQANKSIYTVPKPISEKATSESGVATILLKVPGTFPTERRWLEGGTGWFERKHPDDFVKVLCTDEENKLGYGAGAPIQRFYDEQASESQQGWYIPYHTGILEIKGFDRLMELYSELFIKILAYKGDRNDEGFTEDTFRVNLFWGKI